MFRGKPKLAKGQQPAKTPYTIHDFHTIDRRERAIRWTQPYLQLVSIDPGAKNFAMRIERRYHDGHYEAFVYVRMDIQASKEDEDNCTVYTKLTGFLNLHLSYFKETHIFGIERQLPENYRAVRISQHVISYLMFHLTDMPLLPLIYEMESKLKYRTLGAPSELNNQTLKKVWGPEKAKQILTDEDDSVSLRILASNKKKDDLADVVLLRRVLENIIGLPIPSPVSFTIKLDGGN